MANIFSYLIFTSASSDNHFHTRDIFGANLLSACFVLLGFFCVSFSLHFFLLTIPQTSRSAPSPLLTNQLLDSTTK